jgi:hypothetical protein
LKTAPLAYAGVEHKVPRVGQEVRPARRGKNETSDQSNHDHVRRRAIQLDATAPPARVRRATAVLPDEWLRELPRARRKARRPRLPRVRLPPPRQLTTTTI